MSISLNHNLQSKDSETCEYVWRFGINSEMIEITEDLSEPFGMILEALLDIVQLHSENNKIQADRFSFLCDDKEVFPIFNLNLAKRNICESEKTEGMFDYQSMQGYIQSEPRIDSISRIIKALLSVIELEEGGRVIKASGFRLKKPDVWTSKKPESLIENLGALTTRCDSGCKFCFLKGNPQQGTRSASRTLSLDEAATRIRNYRPDNKHGILSTDYSLGEPFLNKDIMSILSLARKKVPEETFRICTSGNFLNEDTVNKLQKLQPLRLMISLNSADVYNRSQLMSTTMGASQLAIDSISLLKRYEIPFAGSIVAWPTLPLDDIERTIHLFLQNDAISIKIALPGFTREFPKNEYFDTETHWNKIISVIETLRSRERITTPIWFQPFTYAVNNINPVIRGVVRNSPAERAGLLPGDEIRKIDGYNVSSVGRAKYLLSNKYLASRRSVQITVFRDGTLIHTEIITVLNNNESYYPFKPKGWPQPSGLGVFIPDALEPSDLRKIEKLVIEHRAESVLLISSPLLRQTAVKCIEIYQKMGKLVDVDFKIEEVPSRYYGGNIVISDLLVVTDYVHFLEDYFRRLKKQRPDLVVIPKTGFSVWGRDILGQSYLNIERIFKIPVRLLDCYPIRV